MKVWGTALTLLLLASSSCLRMQGPPGEDVCHTTSDCGINEFCIDGKCMWSRCASSSDCTGQDVCQDSQCVTVECSVSEPITCAPYRCAGVRCLDHCITNDDCVGQGVRCIGNQCVEPQCTSDADCRGYACRAGMCVSPCGSTFDCAEGNVCLQGVCDLPPNNPNGSMCAFNNECASQSCCFAESRQYGHCVEACRSLPEGASCTLDEECSVGDCTDGTCSACGGVQCGDVGGVFCGDCPDGYLCNGTICQEQTCDSSLDSVCKDNSFYECNLGFIGSLRSWCGDTSYCDIDSRTCVPYTCEPNFGFCNSVTFRPCDETGHDAGGPARNCELSALDCSTLGCGHVHVENVPTAGSIQTSVATNTCGNLFRADKALSLLSISQVFESAGSEVRWFVYGADAIDEGYASELPSAFVTSTLPFSPELKVELVPGRYYFIGAQILGGGTYAFEPSLDDPPPLEFGRLIDSFCLLNGLNSTLSDRQQNGVAMQQIESVELVP